MAVYSLGKVTVAAAGTPQRATVNETDPTARYACHSFMVQVDSGNSDLVYVGNSNLNRSTGVGVFAVLPVPTTNTLPTFSASHNYAPAGFDLRDVWIDVDNDGDSAYVTAVQ